MPRGIRVRARIHVKTTPPVLRTQRQKPIDGAGPRLWNAKRRIQSSKGLSPHEAYRLASSDYLSRHDWHAQFSLRSLLNDKQLKKEWWKLDKETLIAFLETHPQLRTLSQDVRDFIQQGSVNLDSNAIRQILVNPSAYFSIPYHVPLSMRKQVYFPSVKDSVVLMRTPHLGPRYAAFDVPLHFNKLDLKSYLKAVYNVDVLHIRSAVFQEKVDRRDGRDMYSQGRLFRPSSKKKMTCLLATPFVYPEEPEDLEPWQHEDYWTSMKAIVAENREQSDWGKLNPDKKHRKAIALQAQQMLKGNVKWTPTWQNFADDWRAMRGVGANAQLQKSEQGPQPSV